MKGGPALLSCNCINITNLFENKLSACPEPITPFVAMVLSEIPNEPSRVWTLNQI